MTGQPKSERRRTDKVLSVRLDDETAAELKWAAEESGLPASEIARRGLGPVLSVIRADWYEKHGSEDDWEVVEAVAGERRQLRSSFGVSLSGDQVLEIAHAAEACGVTISAYLREAGLALALAQQAGGTARCSHLSIGGAVTAECGTCGPLPVDLTVRAPARRP